MLDSSVGIPNKGAAVDISSADATWSNQRALYVTTGGTVIVMQEDSNLSDLTFVVPNNTFIPFLCKGVKKTGTTATGIISLW